MKHVGILITMVIILLAGVGPVLGAADMATDNPPNAVFTQVNYEFKNAIEGSQVAHDFTVKNTGKGILEISEVKTG